MTPSDFDPLALYRCSCGCDKINIEYCHYCGKKFTQEELKDRKGISYFDSFNMVPFCHTDCLCRHDYDKELTYCVLCGTENPDPKRIQREVDRKREEKEKEEYEKRI